MTMTKVTKAQLEQAVADRDIVIHVLHTKLVEATEAIEGATQTMTEHVRSASQPESKPLSMPTTKAELLAHPDGAAIVAGFKLP